MSRTPEEAAAWARELRQGVMSPPWLLTHGSEPRVDMASGDSVTLQGAGANTAELMAAAPELAAEVIRLAEQVQALQGALVEDDDHNCVDNDVVGELLHVPPRAMAALWLRVAEREEGR